MGIRTKEGWSYLCCFIDRYSRKILGREIANHMKSEMVIKAFNKALRNRSMTTNKQLIVHNDRGSQYSSHDLRTQLRKTKCRQSMSPKGDCYANAHAESLWATIKKEAITRIPENLEDARLRSSGQKCV